MSEIIHLPSSNGGSAHGMEDAEQGNTNRRYM